MAFVPPGLAKKGGLPPGIQKRFLGELQPEEKVEEIINKEYTTVLRKIDVTNRRITIKEGTAYIYLLVAEDAKIEVEGKKENLSSFSIGDKVHLKLNKDNTVVEIIGIEEEEN